VGQVRQRADRTEVGFRRLPQLGLGLVRSASCKCDHAARPAPVCGAIATGAIAAGAAAGAAGAAAHDYASSVRTKDELALGYRLESAGGKVLLDKSEKRKAQSDGEDLLTPLVQNAAESVAAVAARSQ
jgi:hypothetical protein